MAKEFTQHLTALGRAHDLVRPVPGQTKEASRQRTQLINAIRGHPTEYGWVAPKGPSHISVLGGLLDGEVGSLLLDAAGPMLGTMLDLLDVLNTKVVDLDKEIARRAREDVIARRLMTIPGIGPITATAIAALAPLADSRPVAR